MMRIPAFSFVAVTLVSGGCSSYIQRPVVEEKLADKVHLVSTAASRRANFLADINNGYFVCMEPQPDVRENISRAFVAGVQAGANVTETSKDASAQANLAAISALATAAVPRSVALEYLRTGVFALCQQKYNQGVRDPSGRVWEKFEAEDLNNLFNRAAAIAIVEALSAKKATASGDGAAQSDSPEAMLGEVKKTAELFNQIRAIVTPPPAKKTDGQQPAGGG